LIHLVEQNANLQLRQIEQQVYQEFLSMKWLFYIILFLLALEWFLRKFWGIY
jgi:flagellar biogenesis protein FliO